MRTKGARGFTLLEVVIAAAVMAVGVAAALELFTGSLRLAGASTRQTDALVLARSLIDEMVWRADLDDEQRQGREGDLSWTVTITPGLPQLGSDPEAGVRANSSDEFELKQIVVAVEWVGVGGQRAVRLETARLVEIY